MELRDQPELTPTQQAMLAAKIAEEKAIIEDIILVIRKSGGIKAGDIPDAIGQKRTRNTNEENITRLCKAEREGRIRWSQAKALWIAV